MNEFIRDPALVLYLPLYKLDGAVIKSQDAYGHLCTVTGALWSPQGRDFNPATPDYIEIPASRTQLDFTSEDFSGIARIKIDAFGSDRMLLCRGLVNTDGWQFSIDATGYLKCTTNQTPGTQSTTGTAGDIVVDTWYTIGFSRIGTSVTLHINGMDVTATPAVHVNPTTCARTAKIGVYGNLVSAPWDGKIEFLALWGRALTPLEHQNIHLVIKR